jgi:hypothetical protein
MNSASLYYNELRFLAARGLIFLKPQPQWPDLMGYSGASVRLIPFHNQRNTNEPILTANER